MKPIIYIVVIVLITIGIDFGLKRITGFDLFQNIRDRISPSTNSNAEVKDSTPLEVELNQGPISIYDPSTILTAKSNKEILIDESTKFTLTFAEEFDNQKYYVLSIKNIGIGSANIPVVIKDKSGNSKSFTVIIDRQTYNLPFGLTEIKDWPDTKYTVNGNNLLAKVNKDFKLVNDYIPTDLIDLNADKLLYTNVAGIMLREEAGDSLAVMLSALKEVTGKNVVIASGYRSYIDQYKQYASWVRSMGQEEADKVSARPGYSEHTLGTSVDFMSEDSGFDFTNDFDQTIAGKWLKENSYKYGFVQSYPEGKETQTGYNYEAWHYRYIGIENAQELKDGGLTLREFLLK